MSGRFGFGLLFFGFLVLLVLVLVLVLMFVLVVLVLLGLVIRAHGDGGQPPCSSRGSLHRDRWRRGHRAAIDGPRSKCAGCRRASDRCLMAALCFAKISEFLDTRGKPKNVVGLADWHCERKEKTLMAVLRRRASSYDKPLSALLLPLKNTGAEVGISNHCKTAVKRASALLSLIHI